MIRFAKMENKFNKKVIVALLIFIVALALGLFTTYVHVKALGINYLEHGSQLKRHQAILDGHAGNPWQYRVLAPYLNNLVITFCERLDLAHPVATAFIFVRVILDLLILLLFYVYCRKLGLSFSSALVGMALLAWGMSYSHYDSDLQFNTFFDVIFYLLAGTCILTEKFVWIVPITALAALNRETSGMIPFLILAVSMVALPKESGRRVMPAIIATFVIFFAISIGLRMIFAGQELYLPYGHHPGVDLLRYNLFRAVTWKQLIATLSVIPLAAILGYRKWPIQLRVFFWILVPVWFAIHALNTVMAETRVFLVPQALVFIPGALFSLSQKAPSAERGKC